MDTADLDFIYDVECPVCGRKPTYEITGVNSSGQITTYVCEPCSCPQMKSIIAQREEELRIRWETERNQGQHTVRFRTK